MENPSPAPRTFAETLIRFCLEHKLVVLLVLVALLMWGLVVAPFGWELPGFPRHRVPVDAIPDLGENQQIVFTDWPGRSPQDVEDQVTYPLTVQLLGIAGVHTIRSQSMFGFSSIYVIFEEDVDFYWARARILEKLNSLPADVLPPDVAPALGPDATAMGQIFWYTLEGRTPEGRPAGGWDLDELRTIQDWQVRFALQSTRGVAEVASIGGFEREYQIDLDPEALRAADIGLMDVVRAVRDSNIDVGARTIEINGVEYMLRGRGFLRGIEDIESIVVASREGIPITLREVASIGLGPALRQGALDKAGAEAVGGVVVARYGANPMEVIENVKERIAAIAAGLPRRTLPDGTVSQVTIVPFYDRTGLINETLGTLSSAIRDQVLVTIIVVMALMAHLRSSLMISSLLPLTVLVSFILMKLAGVQANVVALSGIAIAIGTVVDMGIVLCENIMKRLNQADEEANTLEVIYRAAAEVGGAVSTAVATTIVSFLPVFTMTGAEGKLFQPLAYTKTFALIVSICLTLTLLPSMAHVLMGWRVRPGASRSLAWAGASVLGLLLGAAWGMWPGYALAAMAGWKAAEPILPGRVQRVGLVTINGMVMLAVSWLLAITWEPLGALNGPWRNMAFVVAVLGGLLGLCMAFLKVYEPLLRFFLRFKVAFLSVPLLLLVMGLCVWLGAARVFAWLPAGVQQHPLMLELAEAFPGLGREFMPELDEGSYLYMPVTMPHAGVEEIMDYMARLDMAIQGIPEITDVVGKGGRVESAIDPAPFSMIETVINYRPEFLQDEQGRRLTFRFDAATGSFERDEQGELIPDPAGRPYRQWREHIRTPDDIWQEIVEAAQLPGLTSAPRLQPISARIVMLQSGMRAAMGVKVQGPDLPTIEAVGLKVEELLKQTPGVRASAVIAERIVGKPYLEIIPDRARIARFGLTVAEVQEVIEVAVGGMPLTRTVEGRERYPVRVRLARERRDSIDALKEVLIPVRQSALMEATASGDDAAMSPAPAAGMALAWIPLGEVADIRYVPGPMSIRGENTFLTGYVLFDKQDGWAEVDVVEQARRVLAERLDADLPPGVSYTFAGNYLNQLRAAETLRLVLPLALLAIFLLIYLQFSSVPVTLLIFCAVFVAWAGGFLMIWLYAQPWFLAFEVAGVPMQQLFQVQPLNLSVAVWVGFLALFGIATDDGVIMSTYIRQSLDERSPATLEELREAIVQAGIRRIRPCLMTSATTILALLPVLSSRGRGSEIMVPMAIPSFGGMTVVLISVFITPVLYCALEEAKVQRRLRAAASSGPPAP